MRVKHLFGRILVTLFILWGVAITVAVTPAQTRVGVVQGTVTEASGAIVAGANVMLVQNLTNRLFLYNFESVFSGTHIGYPRLFSGRVTARFK